MHSFQRAGQAVEAGFDRWQLERPMTLGNFVLEQIRDSCFHKELQAFPEKTSSYTLIYVLSGSGKLIQGEQSVPFGERDFVFAAPGDCWKLDSSSNGPVRLISVRFREVAGRFNLAEVIQTIGTKGPQPVRKDNGALEELLLGLQREVEARDNYAKAMAESYLQQLVVALCRLGTHHATAPKQEFKRAPMKQELAYQAVRYMDQSLLEIKELSQLADVLGYSYSHLSHVFRVEMGESLQSYWARKRILKAMRLLQSGRTNITGIAETLHYQSIHSFSKAFKKIAGLTPSEYQGLYGLSSGKQRQVYN
ncbi:AraC family transcriptional regulator [Paenibacillus sp. FJAT-26967]|uniref:AraC family transcriptional regulator n=1 Tax=Paenibacillus sp. FJAT-26967 TaxID=1729690 RepID=UPI000837DACA|nr:AraC family transcriptional regulator [Paenibacillus sp. FJAT-26967]